jgi:Mg-chelatase subunit ChlD
MKSRVGPFGSFSLFLRHIAVLVRKPSFQDSRGATIVLVSVSMVALIATAALAIDPARAYILKARLARAVDSGALAGARALRLGQSVAEQRARSIAAANNVVDGQNGVSLSVGFGSNAQGEQTVALTATQTMPTTLMAMVGPPDITVQSQAVSAVPPVDLVLVLDQSGSLGSANAFDDLQQAAIIFKDNFDDALDQMGLVSFQIRGTSRFMLSQPFRNAVETEILNMQSAGDTNAGEGLRLALEQMQNGPVRQRSVKVIVFFTDGRPTAMRGVFGGQDRMMAVYTTQNNGRMRGYFDNPDNLPADSPASPSGCQNFLTCFSTWTEPTIRAQARQNGIDQANLIRSAGIWIYSIGLGNSNAGNPLLVPDMPYLRQLANENGIADPSQPQGKAYFAPTPAELNTVFQQVAADIMVRLAQ